MSTTTAVQTINVEEISTTMENAGLILVANETFADKAVKGAQGLLDTVEGSGMSDELDIALNDWQVKAKQAVTILNNRRAPLTQMMTKLAGLFTAQEGKLDPKKPDSVYAKIQNHRNAWATYKANEKKRKDQEILDKQNRDKEIISIKGDIQSNLRAIFNQKIADFKKSILNKYNTLTMENVAEVKAYIEQRPTLYPKDAFIKLEPTVFAVHIKQEEVDQLIFEEREKLYHELADLFRENMEVEKANTLDLIPSRILELKEIAKAGAAEKARLEKIAEDRRIAEEARQALEQKEQAEKDKLNVQATIQLETAGVLFDATAALTEVKESTGKARSGYKISVSNTDGWGAIFMFYFEKEGKGLSVEEFGKKTLNQMKAFAEKHALKKDEKIDNPFITYEEEFKAVATKTV